MFQIFNNFYNHRKLFLTRQLFIKNTVGMRKYFPQDLNYEMNLKLLEQEIKKEQNLIAQLEDNYLQRTKFCGNILTGFQDYFLQKTLIVHDGQDLTIYPEERLFSLSSVTSEVSKQYDQLKRIPNRRGGRCTRSKNKSNAKKKIQYTKIRQAQDKYQQNRQNIDIYEELSIQSQYNREGSLYKRSRNRQEQRKNKSELNLSDTLSENTLNNSQTLSIASIANRSKKMTKKPQMSTISKRWLNKQKKKTQYSLNNVQYQDYLSEIDEKQGICTLDQLKRKKQLQKHNQKRNQMKTEQQNSDSCDSVDKFIKMARKKRNN